MVHLLVTCHQKHDPGLSCVAEIIWESLEDRKVDIQHWSLVDKKVKTTGWLTMYYVLISSYLLWAFRAIKQTTTQPQLNQYLWQL